MKKRAIAGTIAAAGLALWAAKFWLTMAHELRRYNHIRSLSNEGPVMEETPEITMQVMRQQRQTLKEWMTFFQSLPRDAARYLKIETL
jgi:hypothetical protein